MRYIYIYKKLKSVGVASLVPVFLVWVLLPLGIYWMHAIGYLIDDAFYYAGNYIVPVGAIWWIVYYFKSYVEDEGREIYYLNSRNKFEETLVLSTVYFLMTAVVYVIANYFADSEYMVSLILQMMVFIYMFGGVCYFLIYLTHSTIIPYMALIIYMLYSLMPDAAYVFGNSMAYTSVGIWYIEAEFFVRLLPYIAVTVIAYILGSILNDAYCDYY